MRRSLSLSALTLVAGGISACASLAGLDQITESNCAPNCEPDAGPGGLGQDASLPPSADGATPDASGENDGGRDQVSPDVAARDQGAPEGNAGGYGPESGMQDSSASDTGSDGGLDDATADGSERADAQPAGDAGADADGGCRTLFYQDSFNNDQGWAFSGDGGVWSVAPTCANPPAPGKGNPDPTVDHTTGTASGVLGAYVCGNNLANTPIATSYATSPVVDLSSATKPITLTFYRWLNTDTSTWGMTSTVDVYDGTGWVNLYTNPSGTTAADRVQDAVWTAESYDVSMYQNANFQVRFGYAVTSTSAYSMSCWNVDDLAISAAGCH